MRALSRCLVLVASAASSSCFAFADLGRFAPGDDPEAPSTLVLTLERMEAHFQQYIEARVIDRENRVRSRISIKPLDRSGVEMITINVPGAIPPENGPYRLDLYADVNRSGDFDGAGNVRLQDHAWRIDPLADYPAGRFTHSPNVVRVHFLHNLSFNDIDIWPPQASKNPPIGTGLGARVAFVGASLAAYRGRLLQVRVEDRFRRHTVGLYRVPEIPDGDFVATMPSVLDVEVEYDVKVYVDANGNKFYDNPAAGGADLGFAKTVFSTSPPGTGEVFGIDETFDLATTTYRRNEDVGEP
jgi:hypothetical protein